MENLHTSINSLVEEEFVPQLLRYYNMKKLNSHSAIHSNWSIFASFEWPESAKFKQNN
ncbi:TPA: hypothetical protein QCU60_004938 [Bacillus cereus]|uniref:hypothetical protein n=1 Tax=unclassified Bacillus (in: firmicutes) TaxID=185979 RepID=UPI00178C6A12|nr:MULTISPECIES: hypothetical protein [unclassified Bacillus (in: firmicutes)]HDR6312916.1 hypothetical protein [Bacillus cereus]